MKVSIRRRRKKKNAKSQFFTSRGAYVNCAIIAMLFIYINFFFFQIIYIYILLFSIFIKRQNICKLQIKIKTNKNIESD